MIIDSAQVLHREVAAKFIISCITFKVLPGGQCWNQTSNLPENSQVLAKSPSLPWRLSILKSPFSIDRKVMHKTNPDSHFAAGWHWFSWCLTVRESGVFCGNVLSFSTVSFSPTYLQKDTEQCVTEVFKSPYSVGALMVMKNIQNCR